MDGAGLFQSVLGGFGAFPSQQIFHRSYLIFAVARSSVKPASSFCMTACTDVISALRNDIQVHAWFSLKNPLNSGDVFF